MQKTIGKFTYTHNSEFVELLEARLEEETGKKRTVPLDEQVDQILNLFHRSPNAHEIINRIQSRPGKVYSKTPGNVVTLRL